MCVTERVSKSEFVRLVCFYICSEWISALYEFVHTPDNPIRHVLAFRAFFASPYNLFKLCQCVFQNESICPTVADCSHLLIYGLGPNLWFGKMTHYHGVIHHAVLNDSRSSFLPCLLVSCDCLIWWTWQREIEEDSIWVTWLSGNRSVPTALSLGCVGNWEALNTLSSDAYFLNANSKPLQSENEI